MVKPRQLPSGSWNIRIKHEGKYKSFTADTREEVEGLAAAFLLKKGKIPKGGMTVGMAIDRYIQLSPTLSPTTITAYGKIKQYAFQGLMDRNACDLTDEDVQDAINIESRRCTRNGTPISAKTVKNEWGLVSAALRMVCNVTFNTRLPKYQRHPKEYPSPQRIVEAIRGTDIELPCLLAMWLSFSMSEIRGLKWGDIKDGYIYINRVMVDAGEGPVLKENAKAETRLRKHEIPPYLRGLMARTGNLSEDGLNPLKSAKNSLVEPRTRASIYGRWQTICRQNDLGDLSFHDLRHYSASIGLNVLGISQKIMMERGGWSTPIVMNNNYSHVFSEERKLADDLFNSYFEKLLEMARNGTERAESIDFGGVFVGSSPMSSAKEKISRFRKNLLIFLYPFFLTRGYPNGSKTCFQSMRNLHAMA